MAATRNGRFLSTDSNNKVDESFKVDEGETISSTPPPSEKVVNDASCKLVQSSFTSTRCLSLLSVMVIVYVFCFSYLCWVVMDLLVHMFAKKH